MNILVIGSGGREHALAWKLSSSPQVSKIFCAPGNAGSAELGENVPLAADDLAGLVKFAKSHDIGLTVVGPDDSLALGIADAFAAEGLRVFGPTASAARLESSKAFAKDFMNRHGIPTAQHREFTDVPAAITYCGQVEFPIVVKADGLALGKGVIIAETRDEAEAAVRQCLADGAFGEAGRKIVIEEFLVGVECSIHALVDGSSYLLFPDCRDHKRALDGDLGPNTGGMGTICPSGSLDDALTERVKADVLDRFVAGLQADGIAFSGMLFPGLMLTKSGLKVLEFNCRWGDPETQVLVRRLESDLLDLLLATTDGTLSGQAPKWRAEHAACVILTSGGYPGSYEKGKAISGIEMANALPDIVVFHAGTKSVDGALQTNGGRVLGVTALGLDLACARANAYAAADTIHFDGLQRRNDIGAPKP
jgi:phosphoribosylamine--glycine ligase